MNHAVACKDFGTTCKFDERDAAILAERTRLISQRQEPGDGDFVKFADGVTRRISHVWREEDGTPRSVQTSAGGSWYLGEGYASFSGSLFSAVQADTLTDTGERRDGSAWFFHHNHMRAHNGVDVTVPFRVWTCSQASTS